MAVGFLVLMKEIQVELIQTLHEIRSKDEPLHTLCILKRNRSSVRQRLCLLKGCRLDTRDDSGL